MSTELNKSSSGLPKLLIHFFYLLLAGIFCFFYYKVVVTRADFNSSNGLFAVLSFTANKPFQFRLLIPFIYKLITISGWLQAKLAFMLISVVIVYLVIIAYRLVLKEYFQNKNLNNFLAVLILYPMAWNYIILNRLFSYYDFSAILFYTLGMYFILKDKFLIFALVYFVGLLNKETAAYLVFAYLFFNYRNIFTKKIIVNTAVLVIIFIIIKGIFYFLFRNNPGDTVEYCLGWNYEIITHVFTNHVYAKNLGFCFGGLYLFTILLFVSGKWKVLFSEYGYEKLLINMVFIPFLLFGIFIIYFTEVRVYAELIPVFTTLFILFLSTFGTNKITLGKNENNTTIEK